MKALILLCQRSLLSGAILLGLVLVVVADWGWLSDEITEYPVVCDHPVERGRWGLTCRTGADTLRPTTYRVNKETQEVIAYGFGGITTRFRECVVWDRTTWRCQFLDHAGEFGFRRGRYWIEFAPGVAEVVKEQEAKTYYVSWYRWLFIDWFGT